jgi:hypothetical protein
VTSLDIKTLGPGFRRDDELKEHHKLARYGTHPGPVSLTEPTIRFTGDFRNLPFTIAAFLSLR